MQRTLDASVTPPHVWWLQPGPLLLGFVLPMYLFVVFLVPNVWPDLVVLRSLVYIRGEFAWLGAAALLAMGVGGVAGARVTTTAQEVPKYRISEAPLLVMALLTIVAYLIWFMPALARGQIIASRNELNRLPGITSFTQLGVPFVVATIYAVLRGGQVPSAKLRIAFVAVLVLTLYRVFAWSERLALIEVAVPLAVAVLLYYKPRDRASRAVFGLVAAAGPFLAIPLLGMFFALTEAFRSWTTYSQTLDVSLGEFVVSRLTTYYFTALNNGAGRLATGVWPSHDLSVILDWLYKMPVVGQVIANEFIRRGAKVEFLEAYADVEFNNMSGIFPIFQDVGVGLGLTYFALFGFLCGFCYRSMMRGEPLGAMFYPPLFVACVEALRITYITGSRVFLILVGATVCALMFRGVRYRAYDSKLMVRVERKVPL
jgi:hypothetical protein